METDRVAELMGLEVSNGLERIWLGDDPAHVYGYLMPKLRNLLGHARTKAARDALEEAARAPEPDVVKIR